MDKPDVSVTKLTRIGESDRKIQLQKLGPSFAKLDLGPAQQDPKVILERESPGDQNQSRNQTEHLDETPHLGSNYAQFTNESPLDVL